MANAYHAPPIPQAFIWRRAHSLTGLWLVLFLMEHLFVNSQAALFFGEDGSGFIQAVNSLKDLPYLPFIEIFLLGIPLLIHGIWGIYYLFSARYNVWPSDGSKPSLGQYPRNHAYTWQRITSWILLVGIIAHVIHMRFIEYPLSAQLNGHHYYIVSLEDDPGLRPLSRRLGFTIYNRQQIQKIKEDFHSPIEDQMNVQNDYQWLETLEKRPMNEHQLLALSPSFGIAELLMVRDTFKSPMMILLYTGLVLAACFHAFNGLWTFMISWGVNLTTYSQRWMRKIATGLMMLITFLGLAAIWGTWINLRS